VAAAWQAAGGHDLIERPTPRGSTLDLITATAAGPAGSTGSARAQRARGHPKGTT
jgi:hypothetical protein